MPPRSWVERVYSVRRWSQMPRGGHFAALEQPALLAQDIRVFLRPLRSMHARIPVAVQPKNSDAEGSQL
jgi:hypothetical protein